MGLHNISDIELSFSGMKKGISCHISKIIIFKDKLPAGTTKLSLILEDIDLMNFPHGMQCIDFTSSDIVLEQSFIIIPLTPPSGETHRYQLTVRAFDDNHRVIGVGTVIQDFS